LSIDCDDDVVEVDDSRHQTPILYSTL